MYYGQYHHILIEIYQAVNQSESSTSTLSPRMLKNSITQNEHIKGVTEVIYSIRSK